MAAMIENRWYWEGWNAAKEGKEKEANPYPYYNWTDTGSSPSRQAFWNLGHSRYLKRQWQNTAITTSDTPKYQPMDKYQTSEHRQG